MKTFLLVLLALIAATTQAQKKINDKPEYDAYMSALAMQDVGAKAKAMEAFADRYPNSVVFEDSLDQAMAAYETLGNQKKVIEIARKILSFDFDNVNTLAIVTAIDKAAALDHSKTKKERDAAAQEMCECAHRGIEKFASLKRPTSFTGVQFEKMKNSIAMIFDQAASLCHFQGVHQ